MSNNSRSDHFFIYPKDMHGKYTGHTICVMLRNGRMYHGECLCSPHDQFEKAIGRELAYERAWFEYERDTLARNAEVELYVNPHLKEIL